MAQWDQICQMQRTIQLGKHGENTQWGGGARADLPSASPPVPAPNLLRQQTMSFRVSLAKKKSATLTFDTINFLMLPGAEDPLVKALLDQALSDRRSEFMKTLMEWRDEYQGWQDEKKYYRLEIEAHQEMLRKGEKPVWQTGDSKVKVIKRSVSRTLSGNSVRLLSSPGSPKPGRGKSSDAEDEEDIRTDEQDGSPVRDGEGEDCEGGATENKMVNGDISSEREGAAEIEPATPLSSAISKRGCEMIPGIPLSESSKGKQHHFHKKKGTRQKGAAEVQSLVFSAAPCVFMIPVDGCGSAYACFQINLVTIDVSVCLVQRLNRRDGTIRHGKTCLLPTVTRTSDTRCACACVYNDASILVFACTNI
jgi:hypothetical protein